MARIEAKAPNKAADAYKLAIDLMRIEKFDKDAIDSMAMAHTMGFQVVGKSFYRTEETTVLPDSCEANISSISILSQL
jgi:hypothetical protein